MDRIVLTLTVRKDLKIERPCAENATHLFFLGFDEDLDTAAVIATRDAMRYLSTTRGISWDDAYNFGSIAIDLRITQVVDGLKGVHAMIPKVLFTDTPLTMR